MSLRLTINKESWHYRYHCFVRNMWGAESPSGDVWSLCPYVQITFWGTVLGVLFMIPAILGWTLARLFRMFYKIANETPGCRWIASLYDATVLGSFYDDAPENFEKAPMLSGLLYFFLSALIAAGILTIGFILHGLVVHGIGLIPMLPGMIWTGLLYVGFGIMYIFASFGYAIHSIWQGLAWVASWLIAFFSSPGDWIMLAKYMAWIIGIAIGACTVGLLSWKVLSLSITQKLLSAISMKANGYRELRTQRAEAKKIEQEKAQKEVEAPNTEEYRELSKIEKFLSLSLSECLSGVWDKLYGETVWDKETKDFTMRLGPVGIVWQTLLAVKEQACPIIEFVEPNNENIPEEPVNDNDTVDSENNKLTENQ